MKVIWFFALYLFSHCCYSVVALPGHATSKIKEDLNGWLFEYDSFGAQTLTSYRPKDGLLKAPNQKIEQALQKIGLPTNKHDLNHGPAGKPNPNVIQIKQPLWWWVDKRPLA